MGVAVVERFCAALAAGDWTALAACLAPDVERIGPYGDVVRGREVYVDFLRTTISGLHDYALQVRRIVGAAPTFVAELHETVTVDGARRRTHEALVFDVTAQGIARVAVYLRKAEILGAPALWEQAGGADRIRAVLRDFYDTVFADVMIGFHFRAADKEHLIAREWELVMHALGADVTYTGRPLGEVHARHPIFGGQFLRRRELLRLAIERAGLPAAVREAWLAHTDGLRGEITPDRPDECDDTGAARRRP